MTCPNIHHNARRACRAHAQFRMRSSKSATTPRFAPTTTHLQSPNAPLGKSSCNQGVILDGEGLEGQERHEVERRGKVAASSSKSALE